MDAMIASAGSPRQPKEHRVQGGDAGPRRFSIRLCQPGDRIHGSSPCRAFQATKRRSTLYRYSSRGPSMTITRSPPAATAARLQQ
ncbi:TPA: hypothetical protein L6B08_09910 [Pseudomonas aeruginosa]|uniref:Uncharacterized protein n=1 Tax=Pseudomonas aeruginosa TaxID=287 RepID=A0ABD7K8D0_PSEAI|nr:hypothetical protein B7D75_19675 [Pseudomonas paraeruginosa]KAB0746764.1 hypothetical protein F7O94_12735 [Pseudomonas aeruginosa]MCO3056387.1 hypothetical protein [Pseudomonas aeruginosa]MCO3128110.1 hypothetical protein [Pseudomonas aeruginosa]MCO3157589.1 hypothetical protein [Pseudomonas aeruginosa]